MAVAAVGAGALGCNQNANCKGLATPIPGTDGGPFLCAVASDCPRPRNLLVCFDNAPNNECVACNQNQCQDVVPAGCP
jgi:hypothetical protein